MKIQPPLNKRNNALPVMELFGPTVGDLINNSKTIVPGQFDDADEDIDSGNNDHATTTSLLNALQTNKKKRILNTKQGKLVRTSSTLTSRNTSESSNLRNCQKHLPVVSSDRCLDMERTKSSNTILSANTDTILNKYSSATTIHDNLAFGKATTAICPTQLLPSALLEKLEQEHPHILILPNLKYTLPHIETVRSNPNHKISYNSLREFDILLGRGHGTNYYRGNKWFRKLLSYYRNAYCVAPKGKKKLLSKNICTFIRLNGGRFLERIDTNHLLSCTGRANEIGSKHGLDHSLWYECGDSKAHAKIGQNLREGNASLIRQSIKQKLSSDQLIDLPNH